MRVFIIAAMTADGFIARDADHGAYWTSPEDKKLFVKLTKEAGIVVMGSRTFKTIGKALPGRRNIVYTSRPEQITADGIETTDDPPEMLLNKLSKEGAHSVAVIGGSTIYDLFVRAGMVNEAYLIIEPKIFGSGMNLFTEPMDLDLDLDEVRKLNEGTVLLHYRLR